jgi:saccharopine dehydrogenase-like NADP-dependent oxidoreductase
VVKFIPYHRLFERVTDIEVEGDHYEGYANRDSLKYKKIYGLEDIPTLYRGTLRKQGFCGAWNALVQLGLTDDSFKLDMSSMTWETLTASFVEVRPGESLAAAVEHYCRAGANDMALLSWLGIFEPSPIGLGEASPAEALQKCIEQKWRLEEGDKDMIVMWHRFVYHMNGEKHEVQSSLIVEGDDPTFTAMSKTVGLPIAIAARKILRGEFKQTGVQLPIIPEIYEPVLSELTQFGVQFKEKEMAL